MCLLKDTAPKLGHDLHQSRKVVLFLVDELLKLQKHAMFGVKTRFVLYSPQFDSAPILRAVVKLLCKVKTWLVESALLTGGRWYHTLKYQLCHSTSSEENKVISTPPISVMLQSGWKRAPYKRCTTCKFIKPTRPKSSLWAPTTAAVKASFQSHLSHSSLLSSRANPLPHPVLTLKGDCSRLKEAEGERWWAAYL